MARVRVAGVPRFWACVRGAPRRLLGLDYDGTLAPFQIERRSAASLPGVVEALVALRDHTRDHLALISGRTLDELVALLPVAGIARVGSHGFEGLSPEGERWSLTLAPITEAGLREARARAHALAVDERLEIKPSALACHVRGMPEASALELLVRIDEAWRPLCAEAGLHLRAFDGGLELRAADVDKGRALRRLALAEPAGTLIVYIGDDATDEDAFAAAQERGGIGIRVGGAGLPTCAHGWLPDSHAVLELLRAWPASVNGVDDDGGEP